MTDQIPGSQRLPDPGRHNITLRVEGPDRVPILEFATHIGLDQADASISEGMVRIRNAAGFATAPHPGDVEGRGEYLLVEYRDGVYTAHKSIPVENDHRPHRREAVLAYLRLTRSDELAEHHAPRAMPGYPWPVCTGCDQGAQSEWVQWPCSTAVMIGKSADIEHLSRVYTPAVMIREGLTRFGLTPRL